jgi:hypothetical protein
MIADNQKTSLLIKSQLPEYIRDNPEYSNFVLFLEAYYEWMEQNNKVLNRSKNLLNYKDIDTTTNEFLDYFTNQFLPYFPKETLLSKEETIKVARELYQSKGTPASYKFLFRVLFNSDVDIFYTKDAVMRASSGAWYIPKSLKLSTSDVNFRNIKNLRLFGETTKSIATIESSVLAGTKTEVFISNIERLFQSGEFVRVVDSQNQDHLVNGQPLRAKIVGQISQIKIDPNHRGLLYKAGDPVVVTGGLNYANSTSATAVVNEATRGSIRKIEVINGGVGYTLSPNTNLAITGDSGANVIVGSINGPDSPSAMNVANIPTDTIQLKRYITIGNTSYNFDNLASANANTKLSDAFTFTSFYTAPISSVLIMNSGGGITEVPTITAHSNYTNELYSTSELSTLGVLGPILIQNGGTGYAANDEIIFTGGTGRGAKAKVETVNGSGAITKVTYYSDGFYPTGGMGYSNQYLPGVTANSVNGGAANASLYVSGILGTGADFDVFLDRVGAVTTIKVLETGEDYISTPNVSLKVQDIVVSNVFIATPPVKGDVIYQGDDPNNSIYLAKVDSSYILSANAEPSSSLYNLRVFDYTSLPNTSIELKIADKNINLIPANTNFDNSYNKNGVKTYGDGTARANATFLNGLVVGQGQYLSLQGQPSSFDVLQDDVYNNFTYQITVEKEIAKYREVLLNLLHPTGMKVLGRYALKSKNKFDLHGLEAVKQGHTLAYYTGYPASKAVIKTDFTTKSNNKVTFEDLADADITTFIFNGDTITMTNANNNTISTTVLRVISNNEISVTETPWLTYANVATATAQANSNTINITSLTDAYNIINNGAFSNTDYPLKDIVYAGDSVLIANNTSKKVKSVDYVNGIITLTTNLTSNANSYLSVNRTFEARDVKIYGPIGIQYIPELITENGESLTTEDNRIILLG